MSKGGVERIEPKETGLKHRKAGIEKQLIQAKLNDLADIVMGQAPPGKDCNFEGRGTPFVKVGEFSELRPIIREWTTKPLKLAQQTDVLLCVVGATCGKINLGTECAIGRSVAAIRPHKEKLNQFFLYYFMMTLVEQLRSGSVGAAQTVISKEMMANIQVPLMNLTEQLRIVRILDQAFEAIATAKANAEKNLQNARDLIQPAFMAFVQSIGKSELKQMSVENAALSEKGSIRTGPFGSQLLTSEFVDSGIAVLGIDNAVSNRFEWKERRYISLLKFKELMRYQVKPRDVLITIMGTCGRCAIVPDDIPIAINSKHLCCISLDKSKCLPEYLHAYFLYHPIAQDFLAKKAKGSIMAGLNMGLIKELPLILPPVNKQGVIMAKFSNLYSEICRLESIYQRKLTALDALKKSLLQQAFSGELTSSRIPVIIPFPTKVPDISPTDLHAGILAIGYQFHDNNGNLANYGHVKSEKIAHLVESYLGIDLERSPVKDAAGPNDYPHSKRVEHRARMAGFFDFQRIEGSAYRVVKGPKFDALIMRTREKLGDRIQGVIDLMQVMVGMTTRQAEIFCTVYAAWNNLLLEGKSITDEDIVLEARENWHSEKLKIPREKFFKAILWMKERSLVPKGMGKLVAAKVG